MRYCTGIVLGISPTWLLRTSQQEIVSDASWPSSQRPMTMQLLRYQVPSLRRWRERGGTRSVDCDSMWNGSYCTCVAGSREEEREEASYQEEEG